MLYNDDFCKFAGFGWLLWPLTGIFKESLKSTQCCSHLFPGCPHAFYLLPIDGVLTVTRLDEGRCQILQCLFRLRDRRA
jgi:hypothetical protein